MNIIQINDNSTHCAWALALSKAVVECQDVALLSLEPTVLKFRFSCFGSNVPSPPPCVTWSFTGLWSSFCRSPCGLLFEQVSIFFVYLVLAFHWLIHLVSPFAFYSDASHGLRCRMKLTSLVCRRRRYLDKLAAKNLDAYMKIREAEPPNVGICWYEMPLIVCLLGW